MLKNVKLIRIFLPTMLIRFNKDFLISELSKNQRLTAGLALEFINKDKLTKSLKMKFCSSNSRSGKNIIDN